MDENVTEEWSALPHGNEVVVYHSTTQHTTEISEKKTQQPLPMKTSPIYEPEGRRQCIEDLISLSHVIRATPFLTTLIFLLTACSSSANCLAF